MPQNQPPVETTKRNRIILAVVLAVALVVTMIAVASFNAKKSDPEPEPTTAAVAPGRGPTGGSEESTGDSNNSPTPTASKSPILSAGGQKQAPTLGDWKPVAEKFATAWANPEGGKDAWLKRLRPLTNDKAYSGLENTSAERLPKLTFASLDTQVENESTVVVDAVYTGSSKPVLRIGLAPENNGQWQVVYVTEPS